MEDAVVSKEKTEAQAATMIVADVPAVPAAAAAAMPTAQPTASTSKVALTPSRFIAAGDLVIIFLSRDRPPVPLTVTSGQELVNPYGSFPHDDMIGLPFGAKLASRNHRGFIHLLRPNPELWTLALPHRTQILYTPDMSFISAHLGLTPGARMIEAGTGSGSFSHYATRCVSRKHVQSSGFGWTGKPTVRGQGQRGRKGREVGDGDGESAAPGRTAKDNAEGSEDEQTDKEPVDDREAEILRQLAAPPEAFVAPREGRVWSFEFHAGRALKAWDEFEHHSLFPTLSLRHRNVVKMGFGLEDAADAVFLDLPAPWEALHHAAKAMRKDVASRICCFSPCMEQVLKTVAALRKGQPADPQAGQADEVRWTDIETYECLSRTHLSVWSGPGTLTPNAPIDEAIQRIRRVEEKKSRRRAIQIQKARKERLQRIRMEENGGKDGDGGWSADGETAASTEMEMEGELERDDDGDGDELDDDEDEMVAQSGQKRKREDGPDEHQSEAQQGEEAAIPSSGSLAAALVREGKTFQRASVLSRPFTEMRGHTSYLTFATLLPRVVERQPDPTLEREKENAKRKEMAAERSRQRKQEAAGSAPATASRES